MKGGEGGLWVGSSARRPVVRSVLTCLVPVSKMNEGYREKNEFCIYRSPLSTRYASTEMRYNFSEMKKFSTWRFLWVYLAKAQKV